MTRKHAQLQPHHLGRMTEAQLREQADLAEEYARSRPGPDFKGFFAAMRDAAACRSELRRREQQK